MAISEQDTIKLTEFYNKKPTKVKEIIEIFTDYYGEDKIDVTQSIDLHQFLFSSELNCTQRNLSVDDLINEIEEGGNISILGTYNVVIYYPQVTVTNEFDKSILLNDVYIKVTFNSSGTLVGDFTINKATYSYLEWISHYLHSHTPRIEYRNLRWLSPCLGRGPIKNTIYNLNSKYDKLLWELYCWELDKYIKVESISGVPYIKLETVKYGNAGSKLLKSSISVYSQYLLTNVLHSFTLIDFVKYLLSKKVLKYTWEGSLFCLGHSYIEATVLISNAFISYINEYYGNTINTESLISNGFLYKGIKRGDNILYNIIDNDNISIDDYNDKVLFTFKGEPVKLKIKPKENNSYTYSLFLNSNYVNEIIQQLLTTLNCFYDNY